MEVNGFWKLSVDVLMAARYGIREPCEVDEYPVATRISDRCKVTTGSCEKAVEKSSSLLRGNFPVCG